MTGTAERDGTNDVFMDDDQEIRDFINLMFSVIFIRSVLR